MSKEHRSEFVKKLVIDLISGDKVIMDFYFWDIASSATLTWIFFEDVDFTPLLAHYKGIILARRPRSIININEFLNKTPTILKYETTK